MNFRLSVLFCVVGLFAVSGVYAADDAEEAEYYDEEIIVTAEKREESIMEVPLTVSAFSGEMIDELGMTNELDLEQMVPGLQFSDDTEKTGHGTVIRGIGSRLSGEQHSDLAVATYVDGVYTHSAAGIAPNLFDVERVEVGRGPQGTLHGRNSIAGSISYFTKKPTPEWDVNLLTEFTDQFTQRYNAAFGGPLGENLSFRLTGGFFEGDGAQKNRGMGEDYDAPEETSFSPQLRFKTDRIDVNFRYARSEDTGIERTNLLLFQPNREQPFECEWLELPGSAAADAFAHVREGDYPGVINGQPFDCRGSGKSPSNRWYLAELANPAVEDCAPALLANGCDSLKNEVVMNRTGGNDTTRDAWTVNASFDITETLSLRYTVGASDIDQISWKDGDFSSRVGSAADPLLSADGGVPFDDIFRFAPYFNDNKSHELQLFSNFSGPFNFILGYFQYENTTYWETSVENFGFAGRDINNEANARAAGYASCAEAYADNQGWFVWEPDYGVRCREDGFNRNTNFNTEAWSETQAVFASADYRFNDQWALSAGARWTEDTKGRDQDFFWEALQLWDIAGTPEDNSDDIVLLWDASTKPTLLESNQNPSWSDIIWNVSVEYSPTDDTMYYGRISTGFRAGGFNSASGFNPPIEEETLVNYEAGVKGLYLERHLNVRAGAFFETYDNFQHTATTYHPNPNPSMSSPLVEFTDNIDGTTIWGLELESTYYIDDKWRLSGFYAYLGSSLGEFSAIAYGNPNVRFIQWDYIDENNVPRTNTIREPQNYEGGRLPIQPRHKGAATLSYRTPLDYMGGGTLQLLGTLSYTGERFPYAQNIESQKMAAYRRLDMRAGWVPAEGNWSVVLYVQNALNEVGLIEYLPANTSGGDAVGTLTEARQFGVQLRWSP